MREVLIPLVTVEDQFIHDLFFPFGHLDRSGDQTDRVNAPELMCDDETIEQVFDRREIRPALPGMDIGHIGDPFLVRSGGREISSQEIWVAMGTHHFVQFLEDLSPSSHRVDTQLVHQA